MHSEVTQFDVSGKTLLVPDMAYYANRLMAAVFRAVGVNAVIMDTYKGLSLGKEFTSGKECFPCQVTLGDILHYLKQEKERLGAAFDPSRYVYFLPESDGPCRFGMYNKLQRLVLDRFEEFRDVPIVYLTTRDSYGTGGIMPPELSAIFRKLSFICVIIGDVLDRTLWRVRPYERRPGMTDEFLEIALNTMVKWIEEAGADPDLPTLFRMVEEIVSTAATFIDPSIPRKPRVAIVGEIYVRCHLESNQQLIRALERYGAEVVDASFGEWINYVSYDKVLEIERAIRTAWRNNRKGKLFGLAMQWLGQQIEVLWQKWRQHQVYSYALPHLDIERDHSIASIERRLDRNRIFHFAIGTEAGISIGAALEHAAHGFDGLVNVYPFTCMPSTTCSSVLKPLLHEIKLPFLDAPYDGTVQPNREVAIRTFVYQAKQHQLANSKHRHH